MYLLIIILPLLGSKRSYSSFCCQTPGISVNKKHIYLKKKNFFYSTNLLKLEKLDPNFLAGFIDAEGSFILSFSEDPKSKTQWRVRLQFSIGLHEKDKLILKAIQESLGGIGLQNIAKMLLN
jgi:hypothetical protein